MNEIERVGVVGCGVMGAGLSEVCALAGLDVRVVVSSEQSAERARGRLERSLHQAAAKGKISAAVRDEALGRITLATGIETLADRQLVVEAVTEHEATKLKVLAELDRVLTDDEAVVATNTSSIPIAKLARATGRPGHVLGMHFFSPVPVMPLVELVSSLLTAETVRVRAEQFVTGVLAKQAIWSRDRAGFVVNSLLVPYLVAAIRMCESGFASAEDIDRGMTLGCAHPMGPLRLADLIGLDTVAAVAQALYEEFKEPVYAPPPLLLRMVDAGLLGKKTGSGFHRYR
jgi:3-hydroxybutyryl-CoA dehydrogenase